MIVVSKRKEKWREKNGEIAHIMESIMIMGVKGNIYIFYNYLFHIYNKYYPRNKGKYLFSELFSFHFCKYTEIKKKSFIGWKICVYGYLCFIYFKHTLLFQEK